MSEPTDRITMAGGFIQRWAIGLWLLSVLAFPALAVAAQPQALQGHVPANLSKFQRVGPVDDNETIRLAIGLPYRDPQGLQDFIRQVQDPASPQYRRFLTADEFTERFGPSKADYQAVIDFALAQHLKAVYESPGRSILEVEGRMADIEEAFHVRLARFVRPDGTLFHAPENEPSVDLAVPLSHISGLDDYQVPRPLARRVRHGQFQGGVPPIRAGASNLHPLANPQAGSATTGLLAGQDFRNAYASDVCMTGTGQQVALLEFAGFYQTDITHYETLNSLPSVPVTAIAVGGFIFNSTAKKDTGGILEVSLDIEMAIAMAPGLSKVLVYESGNGDATGSVVLAKIATDDQAKQISCSWTNLGSDSNSIAQFQRFQAQGQAFFQAAGDNGSYYTNNPGFTSPPDPINTSSQIEMTVVGGTELFMNGAGASYQSETTWNAPLETDTGLVTLGGGGGICNLVSIPSYQTGINMTTNNGSTSLRNIPDVSMAADNIFVLDNNGIFINNNNYEYDDVVGTSAATPLWAGFWALANQQAASHAVNLGSPNAYLYAIGKGSHEAADFNDIADGSNNNVNGDSAHYSAVAGYDLATGWGSPKGQSMINDVTGVSAPCVLTPTFTATSTRTLTPSPTPTLTRTRTLTPTTTPTITLTATPNASYTDTFTPTLTLTVTLTPTITLTRTPTPTRTVTLTPTPTPTLTVTLTPTMTFTVSPTPTALPTPFASARPNWSKNGAPIDWVVQLTEISPIQLKIYDIAGELVYAAQVQGAVGDNILSWNLQNRSGKPVANGLYIYWIEIPQGFKPPDQVGRVLVTR